VEEPPAVARAGGAEEAERGTGRDQDRANGPQCLRLEDQAEHNEQEAHDDHVFSPPSRLTVVGGGGDGLPRHCPMSTTDTKVPVT
jgi:hypothetical protein